MANSSGGSYWTNKGGRSCTDVTEEQSARFRVLKYKNITFRHTESGGKRSCTDVTEEQSAMFRVLKYRKKSIFGHRTIGRVCFRPSNCETRNLWPWNCVNRLNMTTELVLLRFDWFWPPRWIQSPHHRADSAIGPHVRSPPPLSIHGRLAAGDEP